MTAIGGTRKRGEKTTDTVYNILDIRYHFASGIGMHAFQRLSRVSRLHYGGDRLENVQRHVWSNNLDWM